MLRGRNVSGSNFRKTSASSSEALGGLVLLGLFFAAYLIIDFLGWWLLVIVPCLYCAVFFVRKRNIIGLSFSSSLNSASDQERQLIKVHFLIVALVVTITSFAVQGSMYVMLAASLCWLATLYVAKSQMEAAGRTKRFTYYLAKSAAELVTIVSFSLAACSIFAFRIGRLPLNTATMFQVRAWEGQVSWLHNFTKSLSPTKFQTLILLAVLYFGRILELRYSHGSSTVLRTWKAAQFGLKWGNRVALAITIAASFTFLATGANGPAAPLKAQLRDMEESYSQLRSETEKALIAETKRQLWQRAWHEIAPASQPEIRKAAEIQNERRSLLEEIVWADNNYDLEGTPSKRTGEQLDQQLADSGYRTWQNSNTITPKPDANDPDADSNTAYQLRDAAAEAASARSEIMSQPLDPSAEMGEELTKNVQEFVDDFERLTDNIDPLKLITDRYPLLGELLTPVNNAFNDFVYAKIKPTVQHLLRQEMKESNKSLSFEIRKQAAELTQHTPLAWHSNDPGWQEKLDKALLAESSQIVRDRTTLRADATFAEKRKFKQLIDDVRQREKEYREIAGYMPEHKNLVAESQAVDTRLKYLESLPPDRDPLAGFNKPTQPASHQLDSTASLDVDSDDSFGQLLDHNTTFLSSDTLSNDRYGARIAEEDRTTLEQLEELDNDCASRVREIVNDALNANAQAGILAALGKPSFDKYSREIEMQRLSEMKASPPVDIFGRPPRPGEFGREGQRPEPRPEPRVEPHFEPHIVP
jgi:hypothetical protein